MTEPKKPNLSEFISKHSDWEEVFTGEEITNLVNALINKFGGHVLLAEKNAINMVCLPIKGGRYDGGFAVGSAPNIMDATWMALVNLQGDIEEGVIVDNVEDARSNIDKQIKAFMQFAKRAGKTRTFIKRDIEHE